MSLPSLILDSKWSQLPCCRSGSEFLLFSQEIEHYLSLSGRCRSVSRVEGLRYLRSRFAHHKSELQEATRIDLSGIIFF